MTDSIEISPQDAMDLKIAGNGIAANLYEVPVGLDELVAKIKSDTMDVLWQRFLEIDGLLKRYQEVFQQDVEALARATGALEDLDKTLS